MKFYEAIPEMLNGKRFSTNKSIYSIKDNCLYVSEILIKDVLFKKLIEQEVEYYEETINISFEEAIKLMMDGKFVKNKDGWIYSYNKAWNDKFQKENILNICPEMFGIMPRSGWFVEREN